MTTPIELAPEERLALDIASAQLLRGENPTPNVAATCVITLMRLVEEKAIR